MVTEAARSGIPDLAKGAGDVATLVDLRPEVLRGIVRINRFGKRLLQQIYRHTMRNLFSLSNRRSQLLQ